MTETQSDNNWFKNLHILIDKAFSNKDLTELNRLRKGISDLLVENSKYQRGSRGNTLRLAIQEENEYYSCISDIQDHQYRIILRPEKGRDSNDKRSILRT